VIVKAMERTAENWRSWKNLPRRLARREIWPYFPVMQRLKGKSRIETGAGFRAGALALRLVLRRP
jgi:hypothetical protein